MLTRRLSELAVARQNETEGSVISSGSSDHSDDTDRRSDKATAGWASARSSLSVPGAGAGSKSAYSPRTPYTPISHSHAAYTPISVERHYAPVVYGEFLLNKVGNNFNTGKGKYD